MIPVRLKHPLTTNFYSFRTFENNMLHNTFTSYVCMVNELDLSFTVYDMQII